MKILFNKTNKKIVIFYLSSVEHDKTIFSIG